MKREKEKVESLKSQVLEERSDDDEQKKIKELQDKMDEAHSHSLAIKEERIGQLEARLEEVNHENQTLREDLSSLRKQMVLGSAQSSPLAGGSTKYDDWKL